MSASHLQKLSIANFISRLADDPMTAYREAEVLAVTPNNGLHGRIWLIPFSEKSVEIPDLPGQVYLRKTVVFHRPREGKVSTFMMSNSFFNPLIAHALTAALDPQRMEFPQDGHLRWHTAAHRNGENGKVYGKLTHDEQTLLINPTELGSPVTDMQIVYLPTKSYKMYFLTMEGTVFRTEIDPEHIAKHKFPECFQLPVEHINCLLTIPRRGDAIPIYGTQVGIFILGNLLYGTDGLNVTQLAVNSEAARIFFRTSDGRIYFIPMDRDFTPKGLPVLMGETPVHEDEQLFSGPHVTLNNRPALLLTSWEKVQTNGQRQSAYRYSRYLLEIPPSAL